MRRPAKRSARSPRKPPAPGVEGDIEKPINPQTFVTGLERFPPPAP